MRVLLQKMMLHLTPVIEAPPVRQLDLLQRLADQFFLAIRLPRPGPLQLIKNAKSHRYIGVRPPPRSRLSGSSRTRRPVASSNALASAGATGGTADSPAPAISSLL